MSEIDKLTHTRVLRGRGDRMTAKERKEVQRVFLESFAKSANVRDSCRAARISRTIVYVWLEKDVEFTVLYHEAEKDADDVVRAAIFQRGVEGYEKPVVSMGQVVYELEPVLDRDGNQELDSKGRPKMQRGNPIVERVYSDALLALLAKARMHEFKDKHQVDVHTDTHTQDTQVTHDAIMKALEPYPEARWALADAIAGLEKTHTGKS